MVGPNIKPVENHCSRNDHFLLLLFPRSLSFRPPSLSSLDRATDVPYNFCLCCCRGENKDKKNKKNAAHISLWFKHSGSLLYQKWCYSVKRTGRYWSSKSSVRPRISEAADRGTPLLPTAPRLDPVTFHTLIFWNGALNGARPQRNKRGAQTSSEAWRALSCLLHCEPHYGFQKDGKMKEIWKSD